MENFQVIQPSVLLAPYVRQYWFLAMDCVAQGSQRLIPSGSIGLGFYLGQSGCPSLKSCLFGQSTTYTAFVYSGTFRFIGVTFQPAGARAFFKMPMSELNMQNVGIDILNDFQILELEKRLADTTDNITCVGLIEAFLLRRIHQFGGYNDKRLSAVIQAIDCGQSDVRMLAQTACLGYKQFKRVFTGYVGANPKDFLRITRFQRTLQKLQIQPQITLALLAHECNYYDMSHLVKEFRKFSGYTPREYLSVCDPYSDYHSLFRSSFIDVPVSQI